MNSLLRWLEHQVQRWYGTLLFSVLVLIEGFLLMPSNELLAFFSFCNRAQSLRYALLATGATATGAALGYALGFSLSQSGYETFLNSGTHTFDHISVRLSASQYWTTFLLALSPFPFNILTIGSGCLKLPLLPLLFFSTLARGLRFFVIAGSIFLWGEHIKQYVARYVYWIIGTLCCGYVLWKVVG